MTDRELLELAAKAAGIEVELYENDFEEIESTWNPLTDDGDADDGVTAGGGGGGDELAAQFLAALVDADEDGLLAVEVAVDGAGAEAGG